MVALKETHGWQARDRSVSCYLVFSRFDACWKLHVG